MLKQDEMPCSWIQAQVVKQYKIMLLFIVLLKFIFLLMSYLFYLSSTAAQVLDQRSSQSRVMVEGA